MYALDFTGRKIDGYPKQLSTLAILQHLSRGSLVIGDFNQDGFLDLMGGAGVNYRNLDHQSETGRIKAWSLPTVAAGANIQWSKHRGDIRNTGRYYKGATIPVPNRAPVLDLIGNQNINEGKELIFNITASDPDGDALNYSASNLPSGASFDALTHLFSWTPNYTEAGNYSVAFSVSDGSSSDSETITITVVNTNRAPIAQAQSLSTPEDTAIGVTLNATDPDGDSLSYSVVSNPQKGTLSGTAPNLTYIPQSNYSGSDSFTFKATDGTVNSNVATVSISVTPVNDAPVANAGTNQSVDSDSAVTLDGSGSSDADGDALTYQWVQTAGTPVTLVSVTSVKPTFTAPTVSTVTALTFQLTVSDGSLSSNYLVTITVNPVSDTSPP
ncbi:MAG: Ig-like domain-containing protein, partial [Patescibacteria group bacterium]